MRSESGTKLNYIAQHQINRLIYILDTTEVQEKMTSTISLKMPKDYQTMSYLTNTFLRIFHMKIYPMF